MIGSKVNFVLRKMIWPSKSKRLFSSFDCIILPQPQGTANTPTLLTNTYNGAFLDGPRVFLVKSKFQFALLTRQQLFPARLNWKVIRWFQSFEWIMFGANLQCLITVCSLTLYFITAIYSPLLTSAFDTFSEITFEDTRVNLCAGRSELTHLLNGRPESAIWCDCCWLWTVRIDICSWNSQNWPISSDMLVGSER